MYKNHLTLLNEFLSEKKIVHSLGVAETAREMAVNFGIDPEKAYIAGLLHDLARELPSEAIVTVLRQNNFIFSNEDLQLPEVLHGYVSAILTKEKLNIDDKEILQSISRHTTGDKDMTLLDAIIFVADMVEPRRNYDGVQELRALAKKDLFAALFAGVKHTIRYLLLNNSIIHSRTIHTYNWLLQEKENFKEETTVE